MIWKLFKPFKQSNTLANSEVAKPLLQKFYKSIIVLYTSPICRGDKIVIDRYNGMVQDINVWYCKLVSKNEITYIPTSFIYDKTITIRK